jgi:hypothetical protein
MNIRKKTMTTTTTPATPRHSLFTRVKIKTSEDKEVIFSMERSVRSVVVARPKKVLKPKIMCEFFFSFFEKFI